MNCIIIDGKLKIPNNKYTDHNEVFSFKGRTIDLEKPIRIYRNLNKKGKWYSVVQNRLTVAHTTAICIHTCKFVVNEKTRDKIRKTGNKEFHAYIEGFYTTSGMGTSAQKNDLPVEIVYNPFNHDRFITTKFTPQFEPKGARFCICNKEGVKAAYIF